MLLHSSTGDSKFIKINLIQLLERTFDLAFHSMRIKSPIKINPFVQFDSLHDINIIPLNIERVVFNIFKLDH